MLGRTLIIANPIARTGKASEVAAAAATEVSRLLKAEPSKPVFDIAYTLGPKDGTRIAKERGADFETVMVVGGDGIIHEVVNGLMDIEEAERPALSVIPCGNGDDFARSLNLSRKPEEAIAQLHTTKPKRIGLGCVNGEWFTETLSFGLDAAIALETMELRKKTKRTGTTLYLQCGLNQLINHLDLHTCTMQLDNNEPERIDSYLFAVQNGPTYGGGFKICPDARLDDGVFSICYAVPPLKVLTATRLFLSAQNGKHVGNPHVKFRKAKHVVLKFTEPLPTQIDGERLNDTVFDATLHDSVLTVYSL